MPLALPRVPDVEMGSHPTQPWVGELGDLHTSGIGNVVVLCTGCWQGCPLTVGLEEGGPGIWIFHQEGQVMLQ